MIVQILAKETGKNDYFEDENLLTFALEREGLKNVYINWNEWHGQKTYLWGLIKINKKGRITAKANSMVKKLSEETVWKNVNVNLNDGKRI